MTRFLNTAAAAAIAFTTTITAGAAFAGEADAIVTRIGPHASAVTYWVAGNDGWDVVTTIDPLVESGSTDGSAVVRVSSRLLPGQSQTVSVPAAAGVQSPSLTIRRVADRFVVETAPVLSD